MKVCVIGRGKVGRTLQRELVRAGQPCTLWRGRAARRAHVPFDVYLLAVPDPQIRAVAAGLAPYLSPPAVVLHCAGARDRSELALLAAQGLSVGVMHPMLSFAGARRSPSLRGSTLMASGDRAALAAARRLARALGANCVELERPSAVYHAAAALVANGAAALAYVGSELLVQVGFTRPRAERALAQLLASVAANVAQLGVPAALTGPVARGDVATVERHLSALRALRPELAQAYASLQPILITCARAAGLAPSTARRLSEAVARERNTRPSASRRARPPPAHAARARSRRVVAE